MYVLNLSRNYDISIFTDRKYGTIVRGLVHEH